MKPGITLFPASMLVVANMIGMGVFVSLGFQAADLPQPWMILALWLVGGILSYAGALSYTALAHELPGSGGEFHFLTQLYGKLTGLYGGVISLLAGFAAPVAVAAIAADKLAMQVWPDLPRKMVAYGMLLGVTLTHAFNVKTGAKLHVAATLFKVGLILVFILAGLRGQGQPLIMSGPTEVPWGKAAVSLIFVMYAYAGWNSAVYVMDEIKDAPRTLPKAMLGGTILVTALYLSLYLVFLRSAPLTDLAAAGDTAVDTVARHVFGDQGGRLMSALIIVGLLAAMSAMTWAGPRVGQAMGRVHAAFAPFAKTNDCGVPTRALWLQSATAAALIGSDGLRSLLEQVGVALTFCSLLTVFGVFKLRTGGVGVRGAAAIFCLVLGGTIAYFAWDKPLSTGLALLIPLVVALGLHGATNARR